MGEDYLRCAAALDDGGVVVGGYAGDSYNGVPSEGGADFVGIKLDSDGAVEWYWQVRAGSRCLRVFNAAIVCNMYLVIIMQPT